VNEQGSENAPYTAPMMSNASAALRNPVITALRLAGTADIAAARRRHAREPNRPLNHLQDHVATVPRPWPPLGSRVVD
jgi:hypothetical protein